MRGLFFFPDCVVSTTTMKSMARKKTRATDSEPHLALDKNTVRSFDSDGRMTVAIANISKATVNPYRGEEIPGYEQLGLEKDRIYQMLRSPEELKKSAATFNGVQLLKKHVPVDADDHQMYDIVGCTGTDAKFDGTYLTNSLHVWTKEGIDYIESGEQRELSCGYHYVPVMTEGIFSGKRYDGVMTEIEGNHVALVEEGRAGHDVVVGDSALSERDDDMRPTRLEHFFLTTTARAVNPLLAMDAKVEYGPLFRGLTTANYKKRVPSILTGLKKAVSGRTIAKDASLEHVAEFLNKFEHTPHAEKGWDESVSEPQHKAMEAAAHGKSTLGIPEKVGKEFAEKDKGKKFGDMLKDWAAAKDWSGGMSEDDLKALDKMHCDSMGGAEEEAEDGEEDIEIEQGEDAGEIEQEEAEDGVVEEGAEEESANGRGAGKDKKGGKDKKFGGKDRKGAMDKRVITQDELNRVIAAERKANRDALEARAFVQPFIGQVSMALDTAEKIYRGAAKAMKIKNADTVHVSALPQLIEMEGRSRKMAQDSRQQHDDGAVDDMAMDDGEGIGSFHKMFPGAARIGSI